jgi:predicted HTH transcriptional regulator
MARVIRDGYDSLAAATVTAPGGATALTVESLVAGGEGTTTEFKSALRVNLHTGDPDPRIELAALKTIAGFLNANGGNLVIGVSDDGTPVGVPSADKVTNEDKMNLHLVNLVSSKIGTPYMMYVHPRFEDFEGVRVMAVECWSAKSPVFVKDGNVTRFYIRAGASTAELGASDAHEYIKLRFKS